MPTPDELHVDFRFVNVADAKAHRVPAKVLAATMEHAQRALHLIAMEVEGLEVRQRARIPQRIEERYVLTFEPPREGSYLQTAHLEGAGESVDLFGPSGIGALRQEALDRFKTVGIYLAEGRPERVREVLPDRNLRLRVLDEFAEMLPKEGEGWTLGMANGTGDFALFTYEALQAVRAFVRHQLAPEVPLAQPVTVGGLLVSLNFEMRTFVVRVGPNNRGLTCAYADEAEALLIENPRDFVRVTGEAVRGGDGQIEQMVNVFDVEDLDLSPFVLDAVALPGGEVLRFVEGPHRFDVELDPTGELLVVRDETFGTDLAASSRNDLYEMLHDEVGLLWEAYAMAPDDALDEGARALKQTVLNRIRPADAV